jgi:hypothetical protein
VLRVGRTKVPASYEYYQIAEGDLIAPERSLFTGNLSGNRQNGFMEHGRILGERAEYALGVFNGPRRSFQDGVVARITPVFQRTCGKQHPQFAVFWVVCLP